MNTPPQVIYWIENNLRKKLLDEDFMMHRLAMLKVGSDRGEDPAEVVRRVIADAVCDAAGITLDQAGHDERSSAN